MRTTPRSIVTGAALMFTAPALAGTIYVNAAAAGAEDGSSWADAFTELQSALAAALPGDEIWVARGTYTPGPPGDAVSSFVMKSGIVVYGGFAGTESALAQRDWEANATILSGDVGHDDVISASWPSGWNINTANSGHVIDASGTNAVIDGFTIANGSTGPAGTPAGDPLMYGSGIYIVGGAPTVRNCTFTHNIAAFAHGGAIYCQNALPTISDCRFVQNYVHMGSGAAVYLGGASPCTVSDCAFSGNIAVTGSGGGAGQGAAIGSMSTQPLTVERCTFEYNTARNFYSVGGVEIARGAGISSFYDGLTVRDCVFRNNTAEGGAGIFVWGTATIVNSLFVGNTVYEHGFSGGGSDGGYGAGVAGYDFRGTATTLINCTFAGNSGKEAVAFIAIQSHSTILRNCIVWGNIFTGQDVTGRDGQFKGTHSIQYSCVQDLLTPVPGEDPPDPAKYPGCVVTDPGFLGAGDYHLASGSPCIDAGANPFLPGTTAADLQGAPRLSDDCTHADTGVGSPPVDMGAYEVQAVPYFVSSPDDASAAPGQSVQFAASATAAGTVTYRWRKDGTALFDGPGISGAATTTLTVGPLTIGDGGVYDVIATGACGSAPSGAAVLTVRCPADYNGDGFVDGIDYDQFNNDFEAGNIAADFNDDGFVDGIDYDQFNNAFESGC